jgi:predicted nucleic acid-binding Zn ribbon protein
MYMCKWYTFWGVFPVLSVSACTEVEDWVIITMFLITHMHVFNGNCHYCVPLFRDLLDNGRVEAYQKVDKWLLIFNRAIVGFYTVSSVCCTEHCKQIYNKRRRSRWFLYILSYFIFVRLTFYTTWLSSIWLSRKTGYLTLRCLTRWLALNLSRKTFPVMLINY